MSISVYGPCSKLMRSGPALPVLCSACCTSIPHLASVPARYLPLLSTVPARYMFVLARYLSVGT
uniref:Uncharacterized protein n=1 Tax=Picea glauca TaxID=3330 RepID=A0A117NFS2_PICGL|nr:hypothetical protein ABT39_MTgene2291 [Picea glauca]QHR92221.1 hypothetical protein Q903MT_gene6260 [Picea sitchensis]